ncbi:TetR/AcrR family transcriptional regulator [Arthrobacter livingstonensis]|uniref:TetR/AcrR family transcriptional regulator n=1 Tax=Arthrobacter livingstonensis TaxID=670078 RepID=A0A2V5LFN6_9MICC|nr:TetR/AcrR family transcriptional regulator [Arthrobacter livingstonensis]PYI69594.1 TetR/AcrR family transcriptional regulator [Arthrobacter livingstonensis]
MTEAVNGPRPYNSSHRRERAELSRTAVLGHARALFLERGFGASTITDIARGAGVSPEFVYKNFGGKPGLVRAIQQASLLGSGGTPAEERSDLAQSTAATGSGLMQQLGRFTAEIAPLAAPILLLIRDAAAGGDADMAALLQEVDAARHDRMLHNARQLAARGFLAPGVGVRHAADIMFSCTAPELYESLVIKCGWPSEEFGAFIATTLSATLLP